MKFNIQRKSAIGNKSFSRLAGEASNTSTREPTRTWRTFYERMNITGRRPRESGHAEAMFLRRSWRPATLQPAVLITVVLFTATVIVAIQLLRHYTAADDGVVFARTDGFFSSFTIFGYLYFPTIIAVCFSMLWNWIDLDVKRMEPFFQLGSSQGASVRDSLLLQYPFDYVALVPLQAARRRHWSVLTSGTIAVLLFWAIIPLQNSMISTREVVRTVTTNASMITDLATINDHLPDLDASLLQNAWATMWYNQSLPAFTTNTSAFSPFMIDASIRAAFTDANVTGDTLRFWTTFDCQAAHFMYRPNNATYSSYFAAVSNDGCEVALNSVHSHQVYCGHTGTGGVDRSSCSFVDQGTDCENAANTLLIGIANSGWGNESRLTDGTATAQFCRMQYWSQQGRLTVDLNDLSYQDFEPSSQPALLEQHTFNTTEFEAILASGMDKNGSRAGYEQAFGDGTGNASSISRLGDWTHFRDPTIPYQPIFGFMNEIAGRSLTDGTTFTEAAPMATAFEHAHQFLFAIALSEVFGGITNMDAYKTVDIRTKSTAVILFDPLAWIVQGFLGIVGLLVLILILTSARRSTNLHTNPDSLAQISGLLEPNTVTALAVGSLRRSEHNHIAESSIFRTVQSKYGSQITVQDDDAAWECVRGQKETKLTGSDSSGLPFHLSYFCGLFFVVMLSCAIALLASLQKYSADNNGIPLPSENQIVQQLVLNYVPIVFATFVEPFWTLLNRSLCLLQPFKELKSLQATASRSIETRYSSLPPQLTFFRALSTRHILLACVCVVAVSSNILAVTMGALFTVQTVQRQQHVPSKAMSQTLFNSTGNVGLVGLGPNLTADTTTAAFQDHFYVAQSNMTRGTNLPPWTTKEYFFLPQSFTATDADYYNVSTRGYGVKTMCQDLAPAIASGQVTSLMEPMHTDSLDNSISHVGYLVGLRGLIDTGNGTSNCSTDTSVPGARAYSLINGTSAYENFDVLMDSDVVGKAAWENYTSPHGPTRCSEMFIASYGRSNNASSLTVDDAREVGAAAPSATFTPPPGANGPCHSGACRDERRKRDSSSSEGTAPPMNMTSQTNLACRTYLTTALFTLAVDKQSRVISYSNISNLSDDVAQYFQNDDDRRELILQVNKVITTANTVSSGYMDGRSVWHASPVARQWLPYLMMLASGSDSTVDATQAAPSADQLIPMVSKMTSMLGSILLSLYHDQILPFANTEEGVADPATSLAGQASYYTSEDRVFLDPTMYALTMALLCVHVVAAVIVYWSIPRNVLERLPTTLADQLGFFEGSTLIEERDWKTDWKYGYGRFVGGDGKPRIGIERAPLVLPLTINQQKRWWAFWKR